MKKRGIFMKKIILFIAFILYFGSTLDAGTRYACLLHEMYINDKKTQVKESRAVYLTKSEKSIFDGTLNYKYEYTNKSNNMNLDVYLNENRGDRIIFPKKPTGNYESYDLYKVLMLINQKKIRMHTSCMEENDYKDFNRK
jgi:hypothetical protein